MTTIALEGATLNQAFPFHFAVDSELRLVAAGPSIARVLPGMREGVHFNEQFVCERPSVPVTIRSFRQRAGAVFMLRSKALDEFAIRGQWIDGREHLLFIGSPWVDSLEGLYASGLRLKDFGAHESVSDYLFLLQLRDQALRDAKDLHERALAKQKELEAAHAELLHQQAMTQRAVSESQEKSVFLSGMSHELRTPLNTVIGYLEMYLEDVDRRNEGDLHRVLSSARYLHALVHDIIDLTKVEAGELGLRPARVALDTLLVEVMESVRVSAERQGTRVSMPSGRLPVLHVDVARLRQIVVNLVSNAIRATPGGTVDIRVDRAKDEVRISVVDTGVGMSPQLVSGLFLPYPGRSSRGHQRVGGGGLGLAMSRSLARLMGGDLEVSSTEGVGSIFTVRLPLG